MRRRISAIGLKQRYLLIFLCAFTAGYIITVLLIQKARRPDEKFVQAWINQTPVQKKNHSFLCDRKRSNETVPETNLTRTMDEHIFYGLARKRKNLSYFSITSISL